MSDESVLKQTVETPEKKNKNPVNDMLAKMGYNEHHEQQNKISKEEENVFIMQVIMMDVKTDGGYLLYKIGVKKTKVTYASVSS